MKIVDIVWNILFWVSYEKSQRGVSMDLERYQSMPNAELSSEMETALEKVGGIAKVEFHDKNVILTDHSHWSDCGYDKLADGSYLVSVVTPMPNVTKEMVSWWFWWHAKDSKRYQAWYPSEHYKIGYHKKDKAYFASETQPPFQANVQYPVERVGQLVAPLSIAFVHPRDFGFSEKLMEENDVETIVCGHVGAFYGLIPNTEMAHILIRTEHGPIWVSRFWIGKNLKNQLLKKLLVTEKQAKGMAVHCAIEYQNFAKKIPEMYHEWIDLQKKSK